MLFNFNIFLSFLKQANKNISFLLFSLAYGLEEKVTHIFELKIHHMGSIIFSFFSFPGTHW
jgi:hypothetical protein